MRAAVVSHRVLIVDDEPVTANLYAVPLESAGHAVLLAASAAELPVLMSSSESSAGVRESLLMLGANDFLAEPVTPAHLV